MIVGDYMFIIEFFRDVLSGPLYFVYLIVCIVVFFALLGVVGDSKREAIEKKLKEKKSYDISSGREAEIASLESKQVLDVMTEEKPKEEEVPQVIVLDSSNQSTEGNKDIVKEIPMANTPVVTNQDN